MSIVDPELFSDRVEEFEGYATPQIRDMIAAAKAKLKLMVPWPKGTKFFNEKINGIVSYNAKLPNGVILRSSTPQNREKMDSSMGTYYAPAENAVYLVMVNGEQLLFQFDEPLAYFEDAWYLASTYVKRLQEKVKQANEALKSYEKPPLRD